MHPQSRSSLTNCATIKPLPGWHHTLVILYDQHFYFNAPFVLTLYKCFSDKRFPNRFHLQFLFFNIWSYLIISTSIYFFSSSNKSAIPEPVSAHLTWLAVPSPRIIKHSRNIGYPLDHETLPFKLDSTQVKNYSECNTCRSWLLYLEKGLLLSTSNVWNRRAWAKYWVISG